MEAFQVATKWAEKNLSLLKNEVIDHAQALISATLSDTTQDTVQTEASRQDSDKGKDGDSGQDQTERATQIQPPPPQKRTEITEQQNTPRSTQTTSNRAGEGPETHTQLREIEQGEQGKKFLFLPSYRLHWLKFLNHREFKGQ